LRNSAKPFSTKKLKSNVPPEHPQIWLVFSDLGEVFRVVPQVQSDILRGFLYDLFFSMRLFITCQWDPMVPISSSDGPVWHHIASAIVFSTKSIDKMIFKSDLIDVKL
jgi:hypothetical protein